MALSRHYQGSVSTLPTRRSIQALLRLSGSIKALIRLLSPEKARQHSANTTHLPPPLSMQQSRRTRTRTTRWRRSLKRRGLKRRSLKRRSLKGRRLKRRSRSSCAQWRPTPATHHTPATTPTSTPLPRPPPSLPLLLHCPPLLLLLLPPRFPLLGCDMKRPPPRPPPHDPPF